MFLSDDERDALDQELSEMFVNIGKCVSFASADQLLGQLGVVQEVLATIWFKHRVALSENQRHFVRAYDRWDVPELRKRAFEAIKANTFPSSLLGPAQQR